MSEEAGGKREVFGNCSWCGAILRRGTAVPADMASAGKPLKYEEKKMEDEQISAGDVVQLKSGGPEMTVTAKSQSWKTVDTIFFHEGEFKQGSFPTISLRKA